MTILSLILLLWGNFNSTDIGSKNVTECESMQLTTEIIGESTYEVSIGVTGGIKPFEFLFYSKDQKIINRDDTKSNSIKLSQKGKYFCAVIDNSGCLKRIEFNINN